MQNSGGKSQESGGKISEAENECTDMFLLSLPYLTAPIRHHDTIYAHARVHCIKVPGSR
jgi:hypothetical protein